LEDAGSRSRVNTRRVGAIYSLYVDGSSISVAYDIKKRIDLTAIRANRSNTSTLMPRVPATTRSVVLAVDVRVRLVIPFVVVGSTKVSG